MYKTESRKTTEFLEDHQLLFFTTLLQANSKLHNPTKVDPALLLRLANADSD